MTGSSELPGISLVCARCQRILTAGPVNDRELHYVLCAYCQVRELDRAGVMDRSHVSRLARWMLSRQRRRDRLP